MALLDIVLLEDDNTATPFDFKTMHDYTSKFSYSFFSFRYDIQGVFYYTGLFNSDFLSQNKLLGVNDFKFLTVSTKSPDYPIIYNFDSKHYDQVFKGYKRGLTEYKGIKEGLEIYKYIKENNLEHILTQTTAEAHKNNFILELNLDY